MEPPGTPARQLYLVDPVSGEARPADECQRCGELETELVMVGRELTGYRLRYAALEAEVRQLHGLEPEAGTVKQVLDHWAARVVEEGWWTRTPVCKPGTQRWSHVRARLKDGYPPAYCMQAVEGQLMQPKRRMQRAWIDAASIFRTVENLERCHEHGEDPRMERVLGLRALPAELVGLDLGDLARRCDCGHLKAFHGVPGPDGLEPCRRCGCASFDDLHGRADDWLAAQARRNGARG